MTANTSEPNPIAESSAPSTSAPRRNPDPRVSGTAHTARAKIASPSGRFTRNTHCHEPYCVSAPPTSGPIAAAPEMTAPHTPNAAAR